MTQTLPGVVRMPHDDYHAHPALSCSGMKKLLPPYCPAIFKHERDHGRPPKRAFDVGQAVHTRVLGEGPEPVVVQTTAKDGTVSDADSYNTKSAQQHRDEIRASGRVPLLTDDAKAVDGMVDAIRNHPIAGALFTPGAGISEVAMFWTDQATGVDLRAGLDWLPEASPGGRLILPDLKTAESANPQVFNRAVARYGYAQQDDMYRTGAAALDLAEDIAFLFVVVEKEPPYVVTIVELDETWKRIGRTLNRQAIELYAECVERDEWPGYLNDSIAYLSPPAWYERQFDL